jgi:hypothetical protein
MRGLLLATLVIVSAFFSAPFVGLTGSALGQDSGRFRVQDEWVVGLVQHYVANSRGWHEADYGIVQQPDLDGYLHLWVINKTDHEERQTNPSSDSVAHLGGGLSFGLYVHRATRTVGQEYGFQ